MSKHECHIEFRTDTIFPFNVIKKNTWGTSPCIPFVFWAHRSFTMYFSVMAKNSAPFLFKILLRTQTCEEIQDRAVLKSSPF